MFKGVFTALITPFRNGQVDHIALGNLIDRQIESGISGLVPCGTTGESATLTHAEHRQVIESCLERVNGRVPVIAGTGSNSTAETIELTLFAQQAGAAAALLITPYYNKPTQEGLFRHYQAVANAVDIPLVLYNVPGRTGVDMQPETVARLARHGQIVAIKEATANMERASMILQQTAGRITLLSGDDATFLPFLAIGGDGVISVTSNIAPTPMVALWKHFQNGELAESQKLHLQLLEINRLLFCETNPIPVKAAAAMMGLCSPEIRLPLTPLAENWRDPLRQAMSRIGLVEAE
ncbi:4-hydroxy-tetrahydrodipicolinate synthase [Candidatus Magnetaquicoccus inordinatus]|uniref:4-hydroxy-tetrahydrodipicolinate synthase n=1 Tax=Candidatus Magnetaquicoccus inordinatus TaxID=2496818 RepID=UPI00102BE6AF|nr:4-hydroxy-tetrahydrodipicolinate synthase [Candidatus Magnetaquicoccus inordinatus]